MNVCPICNIRVSDWQAAGGKTLFINEELFHKACLIDYQLRTGEDYQFKTGKEYKPQKTP